MSNLSSNANNQNLFFNTIKTVFDNWTGFQLSIAHNFGGSSKETKEKAEWFLNSTYDWIIENNDLEDFELEEFFEDTMNNEFNCILDDNSPQQIARLILNYFKLYQSGRNSEIIEDLNKRFPKNLTNGIVSSVKLKNKDQENEDDSSSDEDESDENETNDEPMNEDFPNKNNLTNEEAENFEHVEEGWTFVTKTGKHLTK